MSLKAAISEDTPVKAVLREAVKIGIGLFCAGWLAHGYVASEVAAVRAQAKTDLSEAISRERERNEYLYVRKRSEAP